MKDSTDKHHKKSRPNKCAVPPKLKDVLEFIELVPQNVKLPQFIDFVDVFDEANKPFYEGKSKEMTAEFVEFCLAEIDKVTSNYWDLREYIFESCDSSEDVSDFTESPEYNAVLNYLHFVETRQTVQQIAIRADNYKRRRLMIYFDDLSYRVSFDIEDGKIRFEMSYVFEAFSGVDIERVKICKICEKVFWANRIDAPCCSNKCAHNLRNRLYRERQAIYQINQINKENERIMAETQK